MPSPFSCTQPQTRDMNGGGGKQNKKRKGVRQGGHNRSDKRQRRPGLITPRTGQSRYPAPRVSAHSSTEPVQVATAAAIPTLGASSLFPAPRTPAHTSAEQAQAATAAAIPTPDASSCLPSPQAQSCFFDEPAHAAMAAAISIPVTSPLSLCDTEAWRPRCCVGPRDRGVIGIMAGASGNWVRYLACGERRRGRALI